MDSCASDSCGIDLPVILCEAQWSSVRMIYTSLPSNNWKLAIAMQPSSQLVSYVDAL